MLIGTDRCEDVGQSASVTGIVLGDRHTVVLVVITEMVTPEAVLTE